MKQDMPKALSLNTFPTFFLLAPKNLSPLSKQKKSLMKPDTIDFKSFPAFLLQLHPFQHLIISPHMILNGKNSENSLCLTKLEMK